MRVLAGAVPSEDMRKDLFLTSRHSLSPGFSCVFMSSRHLHCVCLLVIASPCKDTSLIGLGQHFNLKLPQFNLNTSLKTLCSNTVMF